MSSRVRVHELARELGLTSKELLVLLAEEGIEAKSHASTLEDEYADLIREHVTADRKSVSKPVVSGETGAAAVTPGSVEAEEIEEAVEDEDEEVGAPNELHLKPPIIVRDLAKALGRKPNEVIGELMTMNVFAAINQVVEPDIVEKLCARHGFTFVRERRERPAKGPGKKKVTVAPVPDEPEVRKPIKGHVARPPVVAFLGHVDHGKTSLLDAIRETHVTKRESGGITQHIGASMLRWRGHPITFLDTPGHEAFTAMRARGANATDIVVLVVAADDGIMPQTVEAINHAKAAGVAIIVAMNKIDLPNANPDKVMLGLQQNELTPEDWGGDVGVVPVSAITGQGIDDLLERIMLEAEMMELKGNPVIPCDGIVIEAQVEPGMGPTSNIIVRNGTLKLGDIALCGPYYGKIRALIDQDNKRLKSAGPSTALKVLGLNGAPEAGDAFVTVANDREAKAIAEERVSTQRQGDLDLTRKASLEDLFRQITEEARTELKLIIKTDVRGSLEAIIDALRKSESPKVRLEVIHKSVGEITENDILLAAASDAIIVGFHVRVMPGVNRIAKQQGVEVRLYSIIYELLEDMQQAMRGKLEPELREQPLGQARILQVFNVSKTGKICGCRVEQGSIRVGASARVKREDEIIYNGQIQSLRHFKDDVREVRAGQECGIRLDNFEDFEEGDVIDAFLVEKVAPEL